MGTRIVYKYRNDSVVVANAAEPSFSDPPKKRGKIMGYTRKSRRRLCFVLNNCQPIMDSLLTVTMPPLTSEVLGFGDKHTKARRAILARLKRAGLDHYVWVREYTKRGSLHWHIFLHAGWKGRPNIEESKRWSMAWYEIVRQHDADANPAMAEVSARAEGMIKPAGAYAAKEASKRHQKAGSDSTGMAWWRQSRGLTFPVSAVQFVPEHELGSWQTTVGGEQVDIPYKVQFNDGDSDDQDNGTTHTLGETGV